jgi:hypothetical protein
MGGAKAHCDGIGVFSQTGFSAEYRNGGSDKCDGIPMDSLITAAARALAAGEPRRSQRNRDLTVPPELPRT